MNIELYIGAAGIFILFMLLGIAVYEHRKNKKLRRQLRSYRAIEDNRIERALHPYFCQQCNADLIGSIAAENYKCPECGTSQKWTRIDTLIAQALIRYERIPSKYCQFHIYAKAKDSNPPVFFYKRTIMASDIAAARKAAIDLNGEGAIVIKSNTQTENGEFRFVPYSLTVVQATTALASLKENGDLVLSQIS